MSRTRSAIGALVVCAMGLAGAYIISAPRVGSAPVEAGCPPPGWAGGAGGRAAAAAGEGLAAIVGDTLVVGDPSGSREAYRRAGSEARVLRHAANHPSLGTVYVNDVRGPDVLTVIRPGGVTEIRESGEVTHPTIAADGSLAYAVDLSLVRVRGPGGTVRTHRGPAEAAALFSPVFTGADDLVAVAQEPVAGYEGHDDALNNLYRLDLRTGSWQRLTSFQADGDRWVLVRTPVALHDGSLRFVRVVGRGSATSRPVFELWRHDQGEVARVRDLPEGSFLAGAFGSRLVLNVPDPLGRDWRLLLEGPRGYVDLGCGAVAVEPLGSLDPDLMEEEQASLMEEEAWNEEDLEEAMEETYEVVSDGDMAILVGDFESRHAASMAAAQYAAYRSGATVMGHEEAPTAVAPGAYAVVWRLPQGTLAQEELADLRSRFPQLEDRSWIVEL